jgi:anti-sigma regulatory factor (Ser/Thr protein kinase)
VRRYITESRTELELENDLAHVTPVVRRLVEQCREFGIAGFHDQMRLSVAIEEALTNAIIHGNLEISSTLRERPDGSYEQLIEERRSLERFARRRVHVTCQTNRNEARIIIRDEGPGFDVTRLPDPLAPEQLDRPSGRGVLLMRAFLDAVEFNATGNQVTLVKRCGPEPLSSLDHRPVTATCGA